MTDDHQLLDSYLDGELASGEEQRLAEWLAADREHIRHFVRETHLHRQIRESMLARAFEAGALAIDEPRHDEHAHSSVRPLTDLLAYTFGFLWSPAFRVVGLAVAVCVALVIGIWWLGPTMGQPVLAEVQGAGVSLERAGQPLPATAGLRLQPGDVLRTTERAAATITFGLEKTRITIQPGTELQLGTSSHGKRFTLGVGKLEASVARQRPLHPMVITTPQAEARVLGTRFTLTVTTNATRLEVFEGKIRFTRAQDGSKVPVAAGNYAVAASSYELIPQPLTGSILREYWTNIFGTGNFGILLRSPDYPNHPSGRSYLKTFEAPSHWGENYGARITGYLHPPVTGEYTFWIEASDLCELFLSPSEDPENGRQIAYAEATSPREWTKNPAQQSSAITLIAGRRYYIEVLQKQGRGDDHLAVAWQGPGRDREIIPGEFLSPFELKKEKERKP